MYVTVIVWSAMHWRIYCSSPEGAKHPRASAIKSHCLVDHTITVTYCMHPSALSSHGTLLVACLSAAAVASLLVLQRNSMATK